MSKIEVDNISNVSGSIDIPLDDIANGYAKAWVNFNAQGVIAIRDSFNVSSITDNGTGDFTVNFTNNLANNNYVTNIKTSREAAAIGSNIIGTEIDIQDPFPIFYSASFFKFVTYYYAGASTGNVTVAWDPRAVYVKCHANFSTVF